LKQRIGKKIVLLGMMTKIPVAGVVWQTVHYLIGLERLGYDAYYVETHARTPSMLMEREEDDSSAQAAAFIERVLRPFGLSDRWAFVGLHHDGRCYGMTERQLGRLYDSASLLINLHGGTMPLPELRATDRLVYLETDPVQLQVELHDNRQWTIDFLEHHCAYFTFADNYGQPDCGLPVQDQFPLRPTRQPVVLDFWRDQPGLMRDRFTTIGNWRQRWRDVTFLGETYSWSKHHEWVKFLDLPARTGQELELALSSYEEEDRKLLEDKGWHVRHALDFSTDTDSYRDYIACSKGEFSVAKDQNVRLRTGWFSDRSATYLAAGRPVACQDTGFGVALPTGEGLFAFTTLADAAAAIEAINSDYERHSRAAAAIARDYFSHEVVLGRMLEEVGVERARLRADRSFDRLAALFPADMDLRPLSRRPIQLPLETERAVLDRPVPTLNPCKASAKPSASIVVVSYDNLVFTRMCLESVLVATMMPDYELIVVDNSSSDGSPAYLEELAARNPRVRVVLNDSNAGFARACNQGLAIAGGEILVLLNNDALVVPGWLLRLAQVLESPGIGLAGPTTNRIGNEAEVPTSYRTWSEFLQFSARREWEHTGELLDIPTLTMFCLAMRRDAFERIGPLDQRFEVGMLEDDDYSLRAREADYRVVCVENAFVHHFGESSFGKLVSGGRYNELLAENKQRFEEKWGRPWEPYERRPDPQYERLTERIREIADEKLPADATVVIVSKGDDELLKLGRRRTWHFPRSEDGSWAGHHPSDSEEAIAQLELLRKSGGQYLILPHTGFWWLEHYEGFRTHLETRCSLVAQDDEACLIFALNGR
jgi:GT2 family glycosyltransferase